MTYNVLKKPDVFYIGKQDEGKAETIDIDYSAWIERYGDGVITATFQGAEDAAPYDIVLTTANGVATWTVTKANTAAAGAGKLQLNYIVNDVEAKSLIWTVRVYPSMRASGEAPDGYQDWLTALQGLSAETQQNAQNAAQSVSDAEDYADQAKASADSITGLTVEAETLPAGSSATASFDADTDKLSLGIPRGDKGEKGDTGQDGITPDLTIGTTETLPAGSSATATITGTKENPVLNLGIPQGIQGIQGERGIKGDTGATPDISIGTVETLNPDESATATITGTAEDPVLNLGIPKGDTGADGFSPSASVTKQDGNIVITVTDKDGTTSETLEVDDALDETSENPVQNAAIVEAMRSMLPVDTASGAIASFSDGADNLPVKSLSVAIEPVQDLHGYDRPWPGGGGKNKLNNSLLVNPNTSIQQIQLQLKANTVYTASTNGTQPTTGVANLFFLLPNESPSSLANGVWVNHPITITTGEDGIAVVAYRNYSGTQTSIADCENQVEEGSTATAWSPYSNICPITGHTGVVTEVCGKNLFDKATALDGYIDDADGELKSGSLYKSTDYIRVVSGNSYYVVSEQTASMWGAWYDESKSFIRGITSYANQVITAPSNASFVRLTIKSSASGNIDTFAVNYPSTDHEYHAYEGNTYTTTLGRTVYGGTLDIVSGKLTVDRAMFTLNTANMNNSDEFPGWNAVEGLRDVVGIGLNRTATLSMASFTNAPIFVNTLSGNAVLFFARGQIGMTASELKAAMPNTDLQMIVGYETPIEYDLTPQEVRTFLGQNNIWSDTGNTEVMYRADIAKYIEKKVSA